VKRSLGITIIWENIWVNSWKTLKRLTLTVLAAESTEKKYDHDKDGISEKEEK
jgi:hypothetical protein